METDCSTDLAAQQEAVVTRFAALMGTVPPAGFNKEPTPPMSAEVKEAELLACISSSVSNDTVICSLPSLDMKVSEDGDNPLPAVGQHMTKSISRQGLAPVMEASVLGGEEQVGKQELKAARQLCALTSWTKSSIAHAPGALTKNVANSFSKLVDSRVRSWTLLMFKKSLASGDSSGRANLLKMLSSSIKIEASKSSFRALPLPESAKSQAKEADAILPLLFEVVLTASVEGRSESVTVRAPGTIAGKLFTAFERPTHYLSFMFFSNVFVCLDCFPTGDFAEDDQKALRKVTIQLDSGTMLSSMVDQARIAVFKTVAKVTTGITQTTAPSAAKPAAVPQASVSQLPGGFSSSLRLSNSTATGSPALSKARSSALRLNSVLQGASAGKTESPAGIRKQRSVQFDMPMPATSKGMEPSSSKKPRVAQTANRMKSFKSFGRPHAEDSSGGPRNATFGNFGRQQIWGRDGKLANHPMPVNSLEKQRIAQMGEKVTGSVNATFGTPSAPAASRLHAAAGLGLSRGGNTNPVPRQLPSTLPRTATALEGWLMNATGN